MNEVAYRPFFVSGILKDGVIRPEGAEAPSPGRMGQTGQKFRFVLCPTDFTD